MKRWLPAAGVAFAALFSLRQLDDFDTWWHLASGRWIYEHATVPHTDVLSFTVRDHAWINLQWLYDLILFGLYSVGGANSLVIACAVCFTVAVALLVRNLREALGPAATCVMVLWVVAAVNERFLIRPEMATFVLLEAVLLLIAGARRNEGRHLWLLVPLMVLWVNLHALFVLGAVVIVSAMGSVSAARLPLLPRRWREASALDAPAARRLFVCGALALAATLLNPYLVEGTVFPLELLTRIDGSNSVFMSIGEFRPPFSGYFPTFAIGAYQAYFFAALFAVAVAGALEAFPVRDSDEPARFNLGDLVVFAGFAYLSLLARRNVGIFVIGTAPFVGRCLRVLWSRIEASLPKAPARAASVAASVLLPAALAVMSYLVASNWWYARTGESHESGLGVFAANFPIQAARFVKEQELPGPTFNDMTAGGYLTWARPTGYGAYLDGRLEVYDQEFFSRYSRALSDGATFDSEVQRWGIQSVLLFHRWPNRHPLIRWLQRRPDWALVFYDPVAVVFVRTQGNEEKIAKAREAFPELRAKMLERLSAPLDSWGIAVGRYTELLSYAQLMESLGESDEALRIYRTALALGITGDDEINARLKVAVHLARAGQLSQSRLQVLRALELSPGHPDALRLLRQLEAHGG